VVYTSAGYGAPIGLAFGDKGLYFTDIYGEEGFVGTGITRGNIFLITPGNQTSDNQSDSEFHATLAPGRWYPQGLNVVWVCSTSGGSGNYMYDYYFGDGQTQIGMTMDNVYHTYPAPGTYTANCTVRDMTTNADARASTNITFP
jgi:PKD repeat protein